MSIFLERSKQSVLSLVYSTHLGILLSMVHNFNIPKPKWGFTVLWSFLNLFLELKRRKMSCFFV